jgi:hypothetical protein
MEISNITQDWSITIFAVSVKQYRVAITAIQETRWQGKDIKDMKSHTLFYSGKEEGSREFGVAFVVERNMKRNVLDFKAVDE